MLIISIFAVVLNNSIFNYEFDIEVWKSHSGILSDHYNFPIFSICFFIIAILNYKQQQKSHLFYFVVWDTPHKTFTDIQNILGFYCWVGMEWLMNFFKRTNTSKNIKWFYMMFKSAYIRIHNTQKYIEWPYLVLHNTFAFLCMTITAIWVLLELHSTCAHTQHMQTMSNPTHPASLDRCLEQL